MSGLLFHFHFRAFELRPNRLLLLCNPAPLLTHCPLPYRHRGHWQETLPAGEVTAGEVFLAAVLYPQWLARDPHLR